DLLSTYLEELASTLAARCATLDAARRGERPSAEDLLDADLPQIEAAMTEGHPGFLANNGRIGFSLPDYRAYAPEQGRATRLEWVAVRRGHAHLSLGEGLTEEGNAAWSLSAEERAALAARLTDRGLDPAGYHLMPLHPWQAGHRLPITFAPDIARGDLVPLGAGGDEMQPQQSLRTFFNRTREGAPYVKVALAIQNMGFLRGLSPHYMCDTPAINDWLAALVAGDAEFSDQGFRALRARAATGYTGDAYHRTPTASCSSRSGARTRSRSSHRGSGPSPWRRSCTATTRAAPSPRRCSAPPACRPSSGSPDTCAPISDRWSTCCSPTTWW